MLFSNWCSGRLAAASYDRIVHLFDERGERRDKFKTKPVDPDQDITAGSGAYYVSGMAYSPDSTKLAIAQSDGGVFVYRHVQASMNMSIGHCGARSPWLVDNHFRVHNYSFTSHTTDWVLNGRTRRAFATSSPALQPSPAYHGPRGDQASSSLVAQTDAFAWAPSSQTAYQCCSLIQTAAM